MVRLFFGLAILFAVLGVMWHFGLRVGSLPGDITIERENSRIMIPIGTCILISVVLSVMSFFFRRSGP